MVMIGNESFSKAFAFHSKTTTLLNICYFASSADFQALANLFFKTGLMRSVMCKFWYVYICTYTCVYIYIYIDYICVYRNICIDRGRKIEP